MNGEPGKGVQGKTVRPTIKDFVRAWWVARSEAKAKRADAKKFARNQKLFITLLKDKRSGLEDVCRRHSELMARSMVMNYHDRRGVHHCRFCEQTGPLRNYGPEGAQYLVCDHHFKALSGGAKIVTVPTAADAAAVQ